MLKLLGIKKDYKVADGYVHALKGITLAFRKSEFVCVLGQSGCGKTTLLNIIGGLDHYTEGDLVIQNKSTKHFKDRDWDVYRNHRIGFIFQSYNLIPHQTVLGNVEIALTIGGVSREERRRRAKEALERVGLGGEISKRPNQLSGGQMQRVAIARALVNNPDILLADEPTGALDSKTSVQIMDLIKEIAGERLVIMVTHNPELAAQYATRIVRLKDGMVESDSDPYDGTEETRGAVYTDGSGRRHYSLADGDGAEHWDASREKAAREGKKGRTRMGFFTSLALSARNLLTKKGRTVLTSVAGSIGIISVCLVLALSNGFNAYIRRTEEDMLSYYPIQITEDTFDMMAVMGAMSEMNRVPDMSKIDDKVYVNSFLTGLAKDMAVTNDIGEQYVDYIDALDPELVYAVQYGYGTSLVNNLYTGVRVGGVIHDGQETPETVRNFSLSALKEFYIEELTTYAPQYESLLSMADFFGNIVHKMPDTADLSSEGHADYVLSQYDIVGEGHFPETDEEAVLVVGANGAITDMIVAQLGFLDERNFISPFLEENDVVDEKWDHMVDFGEIVGKKFLLCYNDAVYRKNENYLPIPGTQEYPFLYTGEMDDLSLPEGGGIELTVSAVLKLKDGFTYGCLTEGLNLTEQTVDRYIEENMKSEIVRWINDSAMEVSASDGQKYTAYVGVPTENLASYYNTINYGGMSISATMQDVALRHVGGLHTPSSILIYPREFDSKEQVLAYLDDWNDHCSATPPQHVLDEPEDVRAEWEARGLGEGNKISYTDTVGLLMGMMQTMLDVITIVLVAFTAISLVVSSVMIGIITYVSVVERVKEIGVLRSLGARKRDIKNLFNAETFIIGLGAGLFGAAVTYLLEIPINAIILHFSGIAGIASLPILTAGIMVLISVCLTLISGLIPASAAAKKDPVIALRTE